MTAQGWHKDEVNKFGDTRSSGFEKRSKLIKDSHKLALMEALFLTFCRQGQYLLSQTDMRLELIDTKPDCAEYLWCYKGD